MIEIVAENPISIELDISDALTTLGKTPGQITDVCFMLKERKTDADEDAKLSKKMSTSGIVLTSNKFYINMIASDYEDLEINKNYYIAIGILYSGINNFLELDLNGEDRLQILQDVIRE